MRDGTKLMIVKVVASCPLCNAGVGQCIHEALSRPSSGWVAAGHPFRWRGAQEKRLQDLPHLAEPSAELGGIERALVLRKDCVDRLTDPRSARVGCV